MLFLKYDMKSLILRLKFLKIKLIMKSLILGHWYAKERARLLLGLHNPSTENYPAFLNDPPLHNIFELTAKWKNSHFPNDNPDTGAESDERFFVHKSISDNSIHVIHDVPDNNLILRIKIHKDALEDPEFALLVGRILSR